MYEVAQGLGALGLSRMSISGPSLIVTPTMTGAQSKLASQQLQERADAAATAATEEAASEARRTEAADRERRRAEVETRRAAEEATAEQDAILERQRRQSRIITAGVSVVTLSVLGIGGFLTYKWWKKRKKND